MSAARWSGPAIAWSEPANTPPVIVAVSAESAVMDWATDAPPLARRADGLGNAWSDVVVVD